MSAIHITAEAGRTYLMTNGERATVTATTAHTVYYFDPANPRQEIGSGRTAFEAEIESVLE